MAEKLELLISAKNQAEGALKDARSDVRALERQVRRASDALDDTGKGRSEVEQLRRSLDRARGDAQQLASQAKRLKGEIDDVGDSARKTGRQLDGIGGSSKKMGGQMGQATGGMMSGLAGLAGKAGVVGLAVGAVTEAIKGAADAAVQLTNDVASYQSAGIKNAQVFGKQTKEMTKWARAHEDQYGAGSQEVLSYAASLQDVLVPMGFQRQEATKLTKSIGDLVPALTAWDRQGRSSAEITDILTSSLTGERDSLKSLGIVIRQDAINAKVKAMRASGQLAGKTDEEAQAMATLALVTDKSADAQKAYSRNSGSLSRVMQRLRAGVADIKESGLGVLVAVFKRLGRAVSSIGLGGKGKGLHGIADWIRAHQGQIVGFILKVVGWGLRIAAVGMRIGSAWMTSWSKVLTGIGYVLDVLALLMPDLRGVAERTHRAADAFGDMAGKAARGAAKADRLSDAVMRQGDAAAAAKGKTDKHAAAARNLGGAAGRAHGKVTGLGDAVRSIPTSHTTKLDVQPTRSWLDVAKSGLLSAVSTVGSAIGGVLGIGDTSSPRRSMVGPLPGGLSAAHAAADAGVPGTRTVVSAVRSHGLGSPGSDHAAGRAIDITGPGLNTYAARVRASGGYAAFHGSGPQRHLHAVPGGRGGMVVHQTIHQTINAAHTVDVPAAMRRAQHVAARALSELSA